MNRHTIPLGCILGIPIGLDYSWFLIFAPKVHMPLKTFITFEIAAFMAPQVARATKGGGKDGQRSGLRHGSGLEEGAGQVPAYGEDLLFLCSGVQKGV